MRLAVLGAGAVGPAAAVLAARRGHQVALWSPSGAGTAGIGATLTAEGALEATVPVRVAAGLEDALAGAEAALLAVPAYAHPALLPRIAAAAPPGLVLLISPAAALSPLAYDALRAAASSPAPVGAASSHAPVGAALPHAPVGAASPHAPVGAASSHAPVGAMATTPCTARRLAPDRVRIPALRAAVDIAAVPAAAAPRIAALAEALFGHACPVAPDVLQPALANANPIIHAALALANVTRIERAEAWPQYALMTEAACRLMASLEAERDALAAAFGHCLPSLAEALHRASGVPLAPLPAMGAAIAASGRAVNGPATMETRYVTEDVPFGLAFYLWLAARRGIAMPATEAVVTVLESLWGRGLRDNPLLPLLEVGDLDAMLREGVGR